ncbi:MAG: GumC family protein [Armatimonadota bacterium]|jgi:uncharacterized protein involved in exopolysaccharide biosynthesis
MEELSFADLTAPLRARWLSIGAIAIVVTVLVVAYTYFFVPTSWQAESSIVFEETSLGTADAFRQMGIPTALTGRSARGEFLRVLLRSRAVRGRVVDNLNLVEHLDARSHAAAVNKLANFYTTDQPVAQVLILRTTWTGEPRSATNTHSAPAAEMAAQLAKELIASLEIEVSHNDYTEAARRRELLEEQLNTASQELIAAENALVQYATSSGLISLSEQTAAAVTQLQNLQRREAELEAELDGAIAREAAAQARLSTQERMAVSSLAESRDPAIDRLRQRIMDLQQRITEQIEVQGKSRQHPDVASLQSELESAEAQLADVAEAEMQLQQRGMTVDPSYSQLVAEALSNSQRVSEIRANMSAIRGQKRQALSHIEELPARSTEYIRLQRQVEIKGEIVARLTDSYEMARLAEATSATAFSIIDEAIAPEQPSGPSLRKAAVLAFGVALILGVLLAFWMHGRSSSEPGREPGGDSAPAPAD